MRHAKRKKLWIDPAVQGALLRRLLLHWTCFAIAGGLITLTLQVMTQGIEHPFSYHAEQLWQRHGLLFLVMLCLLPAFILDSIKLSHRFVGPIFRLRVTLKALAEGKQIDELRFRKNDYWQGIAGDVNRIAERLQAAQSHVGEPAGMNDPPAREYAEQALEQPRV